MVMQELGGGHLNNSSNSANTLLKHLSS